MQTLTRRGVGDAAAGLGLHFLHMSEGPFPHDAGHLFSFNVAVVERGGNVLLTPPVVVVVVTHEELVPVH